MPTGTKTHPRFDASDPEDRRILIESGLIWKTNLPKAIQLAVNDLVEGRVPMNDKVPPEIAAAINKYLSGEPTLVAREDEPPAGVPEPERAAMLDPLRARDEEAPAESPATTRETRARESIHKMFAEECEPGRDALLAASAITYAVRMEGPIKQAADRISMATAISPASFVEECRALALARYTRTWVSLIQMFGLQEDVEREMTEYLRTFVPGLHGHLTRPLTFSPVPGNDDVFAWGAALGVLGEIWVKGHQQGVAITDLMGALWRVA